MGTPLNLACAGPILPGSHQLGFLGFCVTSVTNLSLLTYIDKTAVANKGTYKTLLQILTKECHDTFVIFLCFQQIPPRHIDLREKEVITVYIILSPSLSLIVHLWKMGLN